MKLYLTGFFSNAFVAEENFQGNLLIRISVAEILPHFVFVGICILATNLVVHYGIL